MVPVVQQHVIPQEIRALDALSSDYVDVFTATTDAASDASPEEWARAAMEGASPVGRFLAWRTILALRLEPGTAPDHIAGWRIAARADDWIRVEARSWFMTANVIFLVADGRVSFATFVRYDRPPAALVWTPVSAVHRRLAPGFLAGGVRRITRRGRAA